MTKNYPNIHKMLHPKTIFGIKSYLRLFLLSGFLCVITTTAKAAISPRGTATFATTNGSSLVINKPTGVVSGDVMLVTIAQRGSGTLQNATSAGWTLIAGADFGGATNRWGTVMYKIAGGAEPASYTFALDAQANGTAGAIIAFSGVDNTVPFDTANTALTLGTAAAVSAGGKTTATANAAVVMLGMASASSPTWNNNWNTTSPGALTELFDVQNATRSTIGGAWAIKPTAGATGTGTVTLSAAERNGAIMIILRAAVTTVTGFNPTSACAGTNPSVVITGTNFTGATAVTFNGTTAAFTINTATQITATLPSGAATGAISVTTPTTGTGTSASNFTVNPYPVVASITGPASVCALGTVTFSSTTPFGVWSSSNSSAANVNSSSGVITAGSAAGSALISYTVTSSGCPTTVTKSITVNPTPILTGSASICLGNNSATFASSTGSGTWISNNPSVATINNSGLISPLSQGTTTFTFTDGVTACMATTGTVNIVLPAAIGTQPAITQTFCAGDAASLSVTATGGSLSYQWYNGASVVTNGGGISGATTATLNFSALTVADASANYFCRVTNACGSVDSNPAEIIVNVKPVIPAMSISACSDDLFTIAPANGVPTASVVVPAGTTYSWPAPVVTGGLTGGTSGIGQPNISGTLNNPTNVAQTATYTVTPTSGSSGACIGNAFTVVVTVNPVPFIINQTPQICSGEVFSYIPANGGGNIVPAGTTFSWGAPTVTGGLTGGSALSGQTSVIQTLTNPTNAVQMATYNVTATSGVCLGSTFTLVLTVNPKPTVDSDLPTQTICSGTAITPINFSNPNTVPGITTYNWTRNNTSNITGIPNGSGNSISGILTNVTGVQQTTVFTFYATSEEGCISIGGTASVVVDPSPIVTPIASQTICSGNNITNVNISSSVTGATYTWTRTNNPNLTGIAMSGTGNVISGSFANSGSVLESTTFTITPSSGGCSNAAGAATFTINVKPAPIAAATPATQTICGGGAFSITASDSNNVTGTTFSFTKNNAVAGDNATLSGNIISGTLENNGTVDRTVIFTITATANGCPNSTTATVIVSPNPVFTATPATQNVCNATAIATINLPAISGVVYSWTRTNPLINGNLTGMPDSMSNVTSITGTLTNTTTTNQTTVFTITATLNGCSKTATASVTVYPTMTAPVISSNQNVCTGATPTAIYMSTPATGGSGTYTYQWQSSTVSATGPWTNVGTGATYQPPATTAGTLDTYYQLIITGCQTFTTNSVLVEVNNNANYSFTVTDGIPAAGNVVCAGAQFTPHIESDFHFFSYALYSWSANPTYITPASGGPIGNYYVVYTDADIGPLTAVNNTNASVTTTVSITPNIYSIFTGPQCSLSPQNITLTIKPKPVATATNNGITICSGTSAGIVVNGNITDIGSTMNFGWTRSVNANVVSSAGTGNSGAVPVGGSYTIGDVLTNTSASVQQVIYTITPNSSAPNACSGAAITITINVNPVLNPGIVSASQTICSGGDPVAFTATLPTGGTSYTYQWQSSTTSATVGFTNIASATLDTYDVPAGLTQTTWYIRVVTSIVNGVTCSVGNSTAVKITVNAIAPGVVAGNQTICSGGDPVAFTITTAATGTTAPTYQWQSNTTGCAGIWTDITGATGATFDPPSGLAVTTYYRRIATSTTTGVPCSDYSNCIIVSVNVVTGGIVGSDQSLCGSSNNPAAFTEITPSTGGALSYQWQSSTTSATGPWSNITGATSPTYDAPAGLMVTTFYHRVTTSILNGVQCTADSNSITVNAGSVTGGAISGNRTVCSGGDPIAFTEIAPATGVALTYQWQISLSGLAGSWTDIAGATGNTYDAPGPITQNTYYQRVATGTVGASTCSAASNFVTVFVNSVAPSVITGNQSVCSDDPAAFSETTPASGSSLTYQWQSSTASSSGPWTNIPGATLATYDPPVLALTTYYQVIIISTLNAVQCTAISNVLTITSSAKTWNGSLGTDWSTPGNWTPSGVPSASNCVFIASSGNNPIITGNVVAYNLTILSGAILTINPTFSITVTDAVKVNPGGQFLIKDSADLIQINNVANTGIINVERITQPMYRFDYTYWGSPMTQASGFTLGMLSPNTLSDKYFSWNPSVSNGFGAWNSETSASVMDPRRGYIVRAPQTFSFTSVVKVPYTANFIGTPNNGDILCPIYHGTLGAGTNNDKYNLLGNPYPSAVDASLFLSDPLNVPVIDGTIYFWTHNSPPSAAYADPFYGDYVVNYTATDYASWNLLGGTGTAATTGGATPNGYIASGQGFFAKSTGTAPSGNPVIFKNSMRTFGNNGQFFRINNASNEKHRVWLNLVNGVGSINQILVGYAEGATEGWDRDFDGARISDTGMILYSIIPDQNLVIQGRPLPFNAEDQVPLGYKTTAAENYSVRIDHLDGLFEDQNVYLEDKVLNVIHNLKESPYMFASEAGTFNERFILRYNNTLLGVQNPNSNNGLVALIINEKLQVQASDNISSISVFDITGKLISEASPENTSKMFESNFNYPDGIYMIKVKFENGVVMTQKLINQR